MADRNFYEKYWQNRHGPDPLKDELLKKIRASLNTSAILGLGWEDMLYLNEFKKSNLNVLGIDISFESIKKIKEGNVTMIASIKEGIEFKNNSCKIIFCKEY